MKKEHEIKELLDHIQTAEGTDLSIEEEAVMSEYQKISANRSGIAIKVLTIFGGLLGTLAFLGFLFVAGLYNSEAGLVILGLICTTGAILLSKVYDKLIFDTIAVSLFVTGLFLLGIGIGLAQARGSENTVCVTFIIIAIITLAIIQSYILAFIAVLLVNGSIMALILFNDNYNLLHVYMAVIIAGLTLFMMNEAELITSGEKISRLYNPVRMGLLCSLLTAMIFLVKWHQVSFSVNYNLISFIAAMAAILYILPRILKILHIQQPKDKAIIYIAVVLLLLPTVWAPAVTSAVLITLLSFWVNYKTGLTLGVIALVYFITQYYYDLQFTLLVKSILLLSSGILFILFYILTNKKLEETGTK